MHSDLNETNATYYYASHWRRFPFCDFSNILFMSCAHLRFTSHLVRKCFENNKMKNSTICISVDAFRQMLGSSVTNQNGVLCVTEFRKICIQFKNVNNNAKLISITETDFRHSYFLARMHKFGAVNRFLSCFGKRNKFVFSPHLFKSSNWFTHERIWSEFSQKRKNFHKKEEFAFFERFFCVKSWSSTCTKHG